MSQKNQDADPTLAEMRHTQCDCMTEIVHADDATDMTHPAMSTIIAHRAILARLLLFGALSTQ